MLDCFQVLQIEIKQTETRTMEIWLPFQFSLLLNPQLFTIPFSILYAEWLMRNCQFII